MGRFRKTSLSYKKSKKSKSREKKGTKFEEEKKTVLKESDRGSWYEQEDWFPENLSSESSADCSDSEDDERLSEGDFSKPANNLYLVSPFFLEQGLNSAASCKYCNCDLVILSNEKGRQGLGTSWIFKCVNDKCPSQESNKPFNISRKSGHIYDVNRAAVLAFRVIGKGHSAARKFCNVIGLSQPISKPRWGKHTRFISEKVDTVLENSLCQAARDLKDFKSETGTLTLENDGSLSVATSFDGSWGSRGWSSKSGLVAAASIDTGKVLDITVKFNSCTVCTRMNMKREKGEMSQLEYLEWYLKHDDDCELNYDGSAQVISM